MIWQAAVSDLYTYIQSIKSFISIILIQTFVHIKCKQLANSLAELALLRKVTVISQQ
jgi:hypothetical protein